MAGVAVWELGKPAGEEIEGALPVLRALVQPLDGLEPKRHPHRRHPFPVAVPTLPDEFGHSLASIERMAAERLKCRPITRPRDGLRGPNRDDPHRLETLA